MKIQSLTVGLRVRHPQYGIGTVKAVSEHLAEIRFDDALRSIDPELGEVTLAEPSMAVTGPGYLLTAIRGVDDRNRS